MIFITGGAGYIGSHCAYELLKQGEKVVIFDNLSTGHYEFVKLLDEKFKGQLYFYQGDLLNYNNLRTVFSAYKIKSVIHFAALSQVATSMTNPYEYYHNNVVGTLNLLNNMVKHNVLEIVFSSTASIYGNPIEVPIKETHPKQPINTYGQTKLIIEQMLKDFDRAYNLKSICLRYFNVIGSNGVVGEWHEPETHLVPCIFKSMLDDKPFCLYGDDYNTKDGTCIRDYIDVTDLAHAHLLALGYVSKHNTSDCFNLGSNHGNTVKEIVSLCSEVADCDIEILTYPRRIGDPPKLIACNQKAKQILGWEPKILIEQSIKSAYSWEHTLQNFKN